MALDKAIEHGKERRKQYHGSKAFDWGCRNHGPCKVCMMNRLYKRLEAERIAREQIIEGGSDER